MKHQEVTDHIVGWLKAYCNQLKTDGYGFVVGISGGVDSALTSVLCALTDHQTWLVNMPIRQTAAEYDRGNLHMADLCSRFKNCRSIEVNLTTVFGLLEETLPIDVSDHPLAMANTRSRLRMTTLYALAQAKQALVAGTGNKIEDFGVGFFTKYGDGGVDISPIADLTKTQVFELARYLNIIPEILEAKPTDGLWEDGRTDEDQLGASYPELEWAMHFQGNPNTLNERQQEVLRIYHHFHTVNSHKMKPIPVCIIPKTLLIDA